MKRLSPYGISRCIYTNTKSVKAPGPFDPTEADKSLAKELGVGEIFAVPLEFLAKESDLVIVLAPGGAATYHIIDEAFLRSMKKSAVLVNTARGSLVDSDALATALKENWLWGAGLDVVEGEPNIGADHPLVQQPRYGDLGFYLLYAHFKYAGLLLYLILAAPRPIQERRWHD